MRFIMTYLRHVICLILSAGILIPLHAQPVIVDVRLTQPPPNQLKVADLWKIDLNNRSGKVVRVYLRGTAEEMSVPDGIIADAHSSEFDCPPGLFRINARQISPIDVDESNDRYRDALLTTGNVPTGDYQICVEVIDAETQAVIGRDCKFTTVNRMSVPILISPPDESDVPDKYPVFTWMASVPPGPKQIIKYKITLAEMFGTQTPADAIRRNPAWFQQSGITRTIIQYPVSTRGFMKGQKYAWMIEAYEERGAEVVTLGESEIWWFTYQPLEQETPEDDQNSRIAANTTPVVPPGECPGDNWDFEIGSLACWEVVGESFVDDPVLDAHPVLGSVGPQGKYWVSSYGPLNADEAVGSMLSQDVKIQNSTIGFMFGGVPGAQCEVELLIEAIQNDTFSMQKRSITGSSSSWWIAASTKASDAASSDRLVPIEWSVLKYLNRTARIMVVDSSKVGHVNVDDFKFFDKEKLDTVKYPVLVMAAGEEHSLVATPKDKPKPKLSNELTANADMISHGRTVVHDVNVINETSQFSKGARASMMEEFQPQLANNNVGNNKGSGNENEEPNIPDYGGYKIVGGVQETMNLSALAALIVSNQVWGWGDNSDFAVGPSLPSIVKEPKQVKNITDVVSLEAGVWNSFGVEKNGTLKGWGENEHAQLGTGDRSKKFSPTVVAGISKVAKVSSGAFHSVGITTEGNVYVWGWNRRFECGTPFWAFIAATTGQVDSTVFAKVPIKHIKLSNVVDVAAGEGHTIVATAGGNVLSWGSNSHGQTGRPMDEEFTVLPVALKIGKGRNCRAVAAGFDHTLVLDKDGTVWAFGGNASGQLGDGTTTDRYQAQTVSGLTGVRAIAAGDGFSLALDTAGRVWAWGNNVLGQLGDGTRVGQFTPVQVSRIDAVTGIVAGGAHAMAVRADGGLWTWGTNPVGQLGEGPITNLTPVPLNPPLGPLRVERLATK